MAKQEDTNTNKQSGKQTELTNQHDVPVDQMKKLQRTLARSDEQEDTS